MRARWLVGLFLIGCGQSAATPPTEDVATDSLDIAADVTPTESVRLAERKACKFAAGALPSETLGAELPLGDAIPVKHIVILMQENRSFDNYFGQLVAQGYYAGGDFSAGGSGFDHHDQVDVPAPGWSNPDGKGGTVTRHPDTKFCYTAEHGWAPMHTSWNGGKNDGFVVATGNADPFIYEDDTIIPFYYALAKTFAIGDRYFASVMTSTWPNRLFSMAATSFGNGDNSSVIQDTPESPVANIFRSLVAHGHTWKDYTDGPHQVLMMPATGFDPDAQALQKNVQCDLMTDIANNTLPDVAFIMGSEVGTTNADDDEGPSAIPQIGGMWVEGILRALMASPAWKDTVVFIVYDENGGMADHVPPEPACKPDDWPPLDVKNGVPLPGAFDHTGFRVPFTVVSPYAKAHYVSHAVYDHTSLLRFIEAKFNLPALTARDANATPPLEMFDFQHPPFVTPPDIKAHTTVDPQILTLCKEHTSTLGCAP